MSDEYLLLLDENSKINQRKTNIIEDNNKLIASLVEKEKFVPEAIENISKFEYNFEEKRIIYLEQNDSIKNIQKYYFETREINFYNLQLDLLLTDIVTYQKNKKKVVLLAGNEINAKKLCDIEELNHIDQDAINEFIEDKVANIMAYKLSSLGENIDNSGTSTPANQGAIKSITRGSVRIEYNYDSVSSESMSNSSTKTSPELTSEEMKVLNKYRKLRF